MLAYGAERLASQCAALVLNANGDPARFSAFGLPVVADDPPDYAGPLAGLLAGLDYFAAFAPRLTHVASLASDMPFAPADFVARLMGTIAEGADIAVASSGGRTHHVAALWPVALGPDLKRALAGGTRKVERFAGRYRVATVEWPTRPIDPFFNVNTPEDLGLAETLLASGGF